MSSRETWTACKQMSRAQFRKSGGCLWFVRANSPGNHLCIPNETRFKIRMGGPNSREYTEGICRNGLYVVLSGTRKGGEYSSANKSVNEVRGEVTRTNAYLYIEFNVGNQWILADELRYDPELSVPVDPMVEEAMEFLRELVSEKLRPMGEIVTARKVEEMTEIVYDDNPQVIKGIRERDSHI